MIVLGSPVYLSYPTGQLRSIVERLIFPLISYVWMAQFNYPILLGKTGNNLKMAFGHNEILYACDTYQFNDYSRYDINMFDEAKKREHRDKQFPIDLDNAYNLGRRLVGLAKEE